MACSLTSPGKPFSSVRAKAAAEKALALDDSLADAYLTTAFCLYNYDWNWEAAERAAQRALELSPDLPLAHVAYANILAIQRRHEDALKEARRALEIDPLLAYPTSNVGLQNLWIRNYDEAISWFKKAIDLDVNFAPAYPLMAFAYFCNGKVAEAVALAEKFAAMFPPHAGSFNVRCFMYAEAGQRDDAVRLVEDLKDSAKLRMFHPPSWGCPTTSAVRWRSRENFCWRLWQSAPTFSCTFTLHPGWIATATIRFCRTSSAKSACRRPRGCSYCRSAKRTSHS